MDFSQFINEYFKQDIKPLVNKVTAKSAFLNLINNLNDQNDDAVTENIKLLTSFFYRTHFAKKTKLIDWINQFKAKPSDVRVFLHDLYCDGSYLYAANGFMLARTPHNQKGYFDAKMNPVELDLKHPVENTDLFHLSAPKTFEVKTKEFEYGVKKRIPFVKPLHMHGFDICFNHKYMEMILNGSKVATITVPNINTFDGFSDSVIVNAPFNKTQVVIMPLTFQSNKGA